MVKNSLLLGACASGLVVLVGCSAGGHAAPAARLRPASTTMTSSTATSTSKTSTARTSPATAPAAAGKTSYGTRLESAALRSADFTPGYQVALMTKGDQVTGQVTLDSCGFNYSSEAHRIARRQYVVSHLGSPVGTSNELVAYASVADAAAALTEFRTAVAHCAKTEGNDLSVQVLGTRSDDPSLPVPDNEMATFRQYDDSGHQEFDLMIFQRHGRYLDALYAGQATVFAAADLSASRILAVTTGKRLAVLA